MLQIWTEVIKRVDKSKYTYHFMSFPCKCKNRLKGEIKLLRLGFVSAMNREDNREIYVTPHTRATLRPTPDIPPPPDSIPAPFSSPGQGSPRSEGNPREANALVKRSGTTPRNAINTLPTCFVAPSGTRSLPTRDPPSGNAGISSCDQGLKAVRWRHCTSDTRSHHPQEIPWCTGSSYTSKSISMCV